MNIDLISEKSYIGGQPHEQFEWLRENSPIYWHMSGEKSGFWALTRYKDVYEVNKDSERFTSTQGILYPSAFERFGPLAEEWKAEWSRKVELGEIDPDNPEPHRPSMLEMDPPNHTEYRKLIRKSFSKRSAEDYIARAKDIAKMIVDDVIDKGECDFVYDVAGRMAGCVTADIMGLPIEDGQRLYEFTEIYHSANGRLSTDQLRERLASMELYIAEVAEKIRLNPCDDLGSKILLGKVDNESLTYRDFFAQYTLILNGGTDTARNILSVGLYELLSNKDQYDWLMEDLVTRIPAAREELLRFISPVVYQCRRATCDTKIGTQDIREGQGLVMYYGAANRDPLIFDEPNKLNLSRKENRHLAFGGGHHVCVGQWLAKVEIDALLHEVLSRMTDIKINRKVDWLGSNFVFGLDRMDITFKSFSHKLNA
ncbi:MAG: cytochrome P450 [Flavobacteriales bacterium]|jgi:cytochrome P450